MLVVEDSQKGKSDGRRMDAKIGASQYRLASQSRARGLVTAARQVIAVSK